MKHSPAPWKWIVEFEDSAKMPSLVDANGKEICNFGDSEQYYPLEGTPPNDENSKLIEAAPELLEALKECIFILEQNSYFLLREVNAIEKAKLAIAKAI